MDQSPGGGFIYSIYGTSNAPQFRLTGGHTVAFWKGGGEKAYFDPNDGQYSAPIAENWGNDIANILNYPNLRDEAILYVLSA